MIEIRTLKIDDDFADLITLSREFFREYESHHKEFFKIDELRNEDVISYFSSFCLHNSRRAYIALDSGHMIGYITVYVKEQADYWRVKQVGEISGLMVQKKFRQKGVAKNLLGKATEFFNSKGLTYYIVYTAVENETAIDFYRNNGLHPLYTTLIGEVSSINE